MVLNDAQREKHKGSFAPLCLPNVNPDSESNLMPYDGERSSACTS